MNRLESIKEGFKMWDNQYPLHPPETRAQEMAQEHVKLLAKGFEQDAPKYVGYLLQRLERYEEALQGIVQKQGNIRPDGEAWEYVGEFKESIKLAKEALED